MSRWNSSPAPRLATAAAVAAALYLAPTGCGPAPQPTTTVYRLPATRPGDLPCPRCAMRRYVWDSKDRHGQAAHHDVTDMVCPDCQCQTSGIWTLVGPSHTCPSCLQGVVRCPMCRAAGVP